MDSTTAILPARRAAGTALIGCLIALAGCVAAGAAATPEQAPPLAPGQARVWFLHQMLPGTAMHPPMIYANGVPIANSPQGTAFYRDFAPGNYVFDAENCLTHPNTSQTLALHAGEQTALQVQSNENGVWDCYPSQISSLWLVPPQSAPYLFAQLTYLGPR